MSFSLQVKLINNPGKTINLPFLADSINEGTITEFVKSNHLFIF